ncbi:hypothetical protein ACFXPV_30850 [Streptomyces sp. NPDC059118]|uniref:hypothetical protein n=1 Tax=unclassified Streptomyces TaxID=2593676 RepID=UPI003695BF66
MSNHFKYVANEFPVTLLFVGVGLAKRGLFSEGESYDNAVLAQTGRRTTRLDMGSFELATDQGHSQWRQLLLALEKRLVLRGTYRGMLADDLSDYLFIRSSGHIGSLMTLINRGCQRAVRTGVERLDEELLSRVKIDQAAHLAQDDVRNLLKGQRSRRTRQKAARR